MGYTNPANSAMPYLQQIPGTITPYFQPYINAGSSALSSLMNQYNTLLTNPGSTMNMLGSGYQQSPGYQYQMNQAMYGSNNAAAAGGMTGTTANQTNNAELANNLANQDYYNYLNHTMGLYNQGLQGMQGINQMGYGASDQLADALAKNLMSEAGMTYAGTAGQNKYNEAENAAMWGAVGNTAGLLGGLLL